LNQLDSTDLVGAKNEKQQLKMAPTPTEADFEDLENRV